jgi:transcriptional regulator with XRE-family HTH domain
MTTNINARGPQEKAFSAQLKYAIELRGLKPPEVGKRTGISPGVVRSYLRGKFLPRKPVQTQLENLLQVRFNLEDPTVMVPEEIVRGAPDNRTTAPIAAPRHLTIPEAQAGIAAGLDIDPSRVEITIRS